MDECASLACVISVRSVRHKRRVFPAVVHVVHATHCHLLQGLRPPALSGPATDHPAPAEAALPQCIPAHLRLQQQPEGGEQPPPLLKVNAGARSRRHLARLCSGSRRDG